MYPAMCIIPVRRGAYFALFANGGSAGRRRRPHTGEAKPMYGWRSARDNTTTMNAKISPRRPETGVFISRGLIPFCRSNKMLAPYGERKEPMKPSTDESQVDRSDEETLRSCFGTQRKGMTDPRSLLGYNARRIELMLERYRARHRLPDSPFGKI